jgi:hypothetical protein
MPLPTHPSRLSPPALMKVRLPSKNCRKVIHQKTISPEFSECMFFSHMFFSILAHLSLSSDCWLTGNMIGGGIGPAGDRAYCAWILGQMRQVIAGSLTIGCWTITLKRSFAKQRAFLFE